MPTLTIDFELALTPDRLWEALKHCNVIFPKIAPEAVASMELIEGSLGEPGSVSHVKFGSIAPEGSYSKEKLLSVDQETKTVVSAEIEGGHMALGFTKWQSTMKLIPVGHDKVKMEVRIDYEGEGPLIEAGVNQAKDGMPHMFKSLENYLLASGDYA